MLSSVFRFSFHEISNCLILQDLIRSSELERPSRLIHSPSWDLDVVLKLLCGIPFNLLAESDLNMLLRRQYFCFLWLWLKVGEIRFCLVRFCLTAAMWLSSY